MYQDLEDLYNLVNQYFPNDWHVVFSIMHSKCRIDGFSGTEYK